MAVGISEGGKARVIFFFFLVRGGVSLERARNFIIIDRAFSFVYYFFFFVCSIAWRVFNATRFLTLNYYVIGYLLHGR